jgi:hypothetical protein
VAKDGAFDPIIRAKLLLPALTVATVARLGAGSVLTAIGDLTDERGHPPSGSIRPPCLSWSTSPAPSPGQAL